MNEWQLLQIRLQMESLITERAMMLAANEHRAMQGFSQAYGDDSFSNLQQCFESLLNTMRDVGA